MMSMLLLLLRHPLSQMKLHVQPGAAAAVTRTNNICMIAGMCVCMQPRKKPKNSSVCELCQTCMPHNFFSKYPAYWQKKNKTPNTKNMKRVPKLCCCLQRLHDRNLKPKAHNAEELLWSLAPTIKVERKGISFIIPRLLLHKHI